MCVNCRISDNSITVWSPLPSCYGKRTKYEAKRFSLDQENGGGGGFTRLSILTLSKYFIDKNWEIKLKYYIFLYFTYMIFIVKFFNYYILHNINVLIFFMLSIEKIRINTFFIILYFFKNENNIFICSF